MSESQFTYRKQSYAFGTAAVLHLGSPDVEVVVMCKDLSALKLAWPRLASGELDVSECQNVRLVKDA